MLKIPAKVMVFPSGSSSCFVLIIKCEHANTLTYKRDHGNVTPALHHNVNIVAVSLKKTSNIVLEHCFDKVTLFIPIVRMTIIHFLKYLIFNVTENQK